MIRAPVAPSGWPREMPPPLGLTSASRSCRPVSARNWRTTEAKASLVLQFLADTGLDDRIADVNPNGGGISLGHPLGATGARITATLLNELERRGERYGIATMCIGFGQALAGVVERL